MINNRGGDTSLGVGVKSALLASSDKADWDAVAGVEAFCQPDTSSEPEASSEPDAPSDCAADPEGVSLNMHSSAD